MVTINASHAIRLRDWLNQRAEELDNVPIGSLSDGPFGNPGRHGVMRWKRCFYQNGTRGTVGCIAGENQLMCGQIRITDYAVPLLERDLFGKIKQSEDSVMFSIIYLNGWPQKVLQQEFLSQSTVGGQLRVMPKRVGALLTEYQHKVVTA